MWSLRGGKSQQEIMASYKIGSSAMYDVKKQKKLHLFMASSES
jgi:hypothetical protein